MKKILKRLFVLITLTVLFFPSFYFVGIMMLILEGTHPAYYTDKLIKWAEKYLNLNKL